MPLPHASAQLLATCRSDPEVRRLVAAIKLDILLWRYRRKYRPDQPRDDRGRWTDGGGSGSRGNDPRVISDATSDNVKPGARYAQARKPGGYAVDLREEQRLGGHSIEEHVGKSETYLKTRVRAEAAKIVDRGDDFRGLGVGSFTSFDSANRLVNSTIGQNPTLVEQVVRGERDAALLSSRFGAATGSEAYLPTYHSQPYMRDTYGVGVVILRDPRVEKGFRVQTAFPRH